MLVKLINKENKKLQLLPKRESFLVASSTPSPLCVTFPNQGEVFRMH